MLVGPCDEEQFCLWRAVSRENWKGPGQDVGLMNWLCVPRTSLDLERASGEGVFGIFIAPSGCNPRGWWEAQVQGLACYRPTN